MPRYFYHVSRRQFDTGTRLTPSGKPYLGPKIEAALEQRRPAEMLSRTEAVYLAPNYHNFRLYGQLSGYVYRVQPEGKVEGHDVHWIGELQRSAGKRDMTFPPTEYMDWTERTLDYLCANYWWGEPSDRPVWEYLAPAAVIVKVLGRDTD
jgi:hypothetical protein